jgi:hypothetical protein
MTDLTLWGCVNISDISMEKIFECCSDISFLNVKGCPNITDVIKNKFRIREGFILID